MTAKPTIAERNRVPHYLLDCVDPTAYITAGEYARQARKVLGVRTVKLGMDEGWAWYLPKMPSGAEDAPVKERAPSGREGIFEAEGEPEDRPALEPPNDSPDELT